MQRMVSTRELEVAIRHYLDQHNRNPKPIYLD